MIEFYSAIKLVHIGAVVASGGLFFARGLALQLGGAWAMAAPLRYLSYAIDTVLLTAAMMLASMLHQYPFVNSWLTAKVALLVVYVLLGSYALKRGRTPAVRAICWVAALCVFGMIVSIALAHDPLGVLGSVLRRP